MGGLDKLVIHFAILQGILLCMIFNDSRLGLCSRNNYFNAVVYLSYSSAHYQFLLLSTTITNSVIMSE